MFANFDLDVIRRSLGYLFFDGMTFTLTLTGLSALGGLIFGTLIALMRLSSFRLLGRIAERLRLESEEEFQFVVDLISATFTRGIEFGAVEVTAQQIELGQQTAPATIEIAHVDLP